MYGPSTQVDQKKLFESRLKEQASPVIEAPRQRSQSSANPAPSRHVAVIVLRLMAALLSPSNCVGRKRQNRLSTLTQLAPVAKRRNYRVNKVSFRVRYAKYEVLKMASYNSRLTVILRKAGWKEGRNESEIAEEYKRAMGSAWLPEVEPFVRSFGGLTIDKNLWVYPERAAHDLSLRSRVETVVGSSVCPVAVSGYMGDGATLWIDSQGRFYVVDSEGMLFLGENIEEALNVLFLGEKPPEPPEEIRESLSQAWEWQK